MDVLGMEHEASMMDFVKQSIGDSPTHTAATIETWIEFDRFNLDIVANVRMGMILGLHDGGGGTVWDRAQIIASINGMLSEIPESKTILVSGNIWGDGKIDEGVKSLLVMRDEMINNRKLLATNLGAANS